MDPYSYVSNAHGSYIEGLYQTYKQNPEEVDASWQKFFEGFEFHAQYNGQDGVATPTEASAGVDVKDLLVRDYITAYRTRGHLISKTNPVRQRRDRKARVDIEDFDLSEADLQTTFQAGEMLGIGQATLEKIRETLRYIYGGTVGFEYTYIREPEKLQWLRQKIEKDALAFDPSSDEKKRILSKLNEAVVFENFLHTKYLGQKRFSLEGGETTIAALDAMIRAAADEGVKEVMIGMAHRGRLNVLANIMGKTYEQIFNEFEGQAQPNLSMGDGDVKYHLGYSSQITTPNGKKIDLKLSPNPSHLEAVDPVVEGFVRAKIDKQYDNDEDSAMPVLIHGDAAVAGQGLVYEVVQMSKLKGYSTGGTIHFVINNQVGFTTDFDEARSSIYCTDLAKIVDAPVLHVNGDDPEAVVFCCKLAVEFRQRYNSDIWVDMVCYRRHGHNESDEPKFTQPDLYNKISKHPNPREVYNKKLMEQDDFSKNLAAEMDKEFRKLLDDRLNMVKQTPLPYEYQPLEKEWQAMEFAQPEAFDQSPETGVSQETIDKIAAALTTIPEGFKPIRQIEKALKQRKDMFSSGRVNWATAELLAYGSLLLENKVVRLVGQDSQRGTFSHRHSVLHDANTNEEYCNLDHIAEGQEKMRVFNSLLSEYAAMGFEFGYAMANPNALVIWEAQFGDFANGAQVMIDQFVSCSETKWQRMNGMVLLLPHGYEGQGPEHSSARLERFLQLSAEYNMVVANVTSPANFFHLLRRQMAWNFRKPCVVMSPKSLLRHPRVESAVTDLTQGTFNEVIDDAFVADKAKVKRLLLCSGKVYFDLLERQEKEERHDVAIIRLEQLHPLPEKQLQAVLDGYPEGVELVWVQEEPENKGPWTYILRLLRHLPLDVVSRKPSASPATGYAKVHAKEQNDIIDKAFSL